MRSGIDMIRKATVSILLMLVAAGVRAADKLTIVKAGPVGEIASLAEANEIRVVFSEPMVVLGKIPKVVTAPFFHISPAVNGAFRWSGTTTLIFTPDAKTPLPFSTKFDVVIDDTAKSVSSKKLDRAYNFSFTTPTIALLNTNWYRKGGRFDAPVVIALRFNQPVDGATIGSHLQLRTKSHEFNDPQPPVEKDPAFEAKLAAAHAAAASDDAPILSFFPTDWDKKRFPPAKDLLVVETKPGVPPDTWIQVHLDEQLAEGTSKVASGRSQSYTIQLTPAFFVSGIDCKLACNPENYNPIALRASAKWEHIRDTITVVDTTDPAHPVSLVRGKRDVPDWQNVTSSVSLDELGFTIAPAHTYTIRVDPNLESEDGQKLGYTWQAVV